jgi:hypothetical protein
MNLRAASARKLLFNRSVQVSVQTEGIFIKDLLVQYNGNQLLIPALFKYLEVFSKLRLGQASPSIFIRRGVMEGRACHDRFLSFEFASPCRFRIIFIFFPCPLSASSLQNARTG